MRKCCEYNLCFAGSFVIGTSRQDGFMHYRNVVCLLSCSYRLHGTFKRVAYHEISLSDLSRQ
ncbi:TPA: hypothetical protein HMP99_08340 [Escherichia coli]|nr:hypothetical protein [Escherichia coli]